MQVTIRLFAGLRDVVGGDITEEFEQDSVTVGELRERLEESQPKLKPYLPGVAIAVNEDYILDTTHELRHGDTVALVPPISGGAANETPLFLVTSEPLQPQALRDAVMTPASGAAVVFEGVVRNHHEGRAVDHLEYEAYPEMAERQLRLVAEEVVREFAGREVHRIAAHHRTGRLTVGETSLVVAVSAAHRRDAFEAALRAVDRIKETVPVWKKEYGPDGSRWQECVEPRPVQR